MRILGSVVLILLLAVLDARQHFGLRGTIAFSVSIPVTATELIADTKANEVAAEKYRGNTLAVSRNVGTIGKDILGTRYVTLESEQHAINRFSVCLMIIGGRHYL